MASTPSPAPRRSEDSSFQATRFLNLLLQSPTKHVATGQAPPLIKIGLLPDQLIKALFLGYTARNPQMGHDLIVGIAQRCGMGFEPAMTALQANHLELECPGLALADLLVQGGKRFPVFRRDDAENALAGNLVQGIRLDHVESGAVHLPQRAVRIQDLDALGFGLDDGQQLALA